MSCSSAATIEHVGPADERISAEASMQVSTTCRSTVKRWIGRGVRQQPDPLPLGQEPGQRAGLLEGLPDREQPAARRPAAAPAARRASAGHGSGSGAHSRASRAAVGGREHDVALGGRRGGAQQQHRVLGRAGACGRARPRRRRARRPRRSGVSDGSARRRGAARAGPARRRRGARSSRDRWVIRRPSSRTCTWAPRGVGRARAARRGRSTAPARPGRWAARRSSCSCVADVEQGQPGALQLDVGHVDQPGRHQRLEHGGVAQPALGLLEVGHRDVGELAHQLVAARAPGRAARAAARGRCAASWRASWRAAAA